MKPDTSTGRIPANMSLAAWASVTPRTCNRPYPYVGRCRSVQRWKARLPRVVRTRIAGAGCGRRLVRVYSRCGRAIRIIAVTCRVTGKKQRLSVHAW
jgi:hypothetical protein